MKHYEVLLGDQWDLRNRYLHIHASSEWREQPNRSIEVETGQVQDKYRTSTGQVLDKLHTCNACIIRLVEVIGSGQLSVRSMMEGVGLKGRDNFLNTYLRPAIQEGYVCMLYPQSPRHPRQRYLLTAKGQTLWNEMNRT